MNEAIDNAGGTYSAGFSMPKLIVDTREKLPLEFQHLETVPGTLTTGDYSIAGFTHRFGAERKTMADVVASLTTRREAFFKELERGRGMDFFRLLVIGTPKELREVLERRRASLESIVGSLCYINANIVPVVTAPSPYKAAQLVERWACYFYAGAARPFGKFQIPAWCRDGVI